MTQARAWLAPAAALALLFGLEYPNPDLSGEPSPLPNDHTMVLAANEAPNDEAQAQTEDKSGAQNDDQATPPATHPGNEN
jgi:hypothetical protein